MVHVIKQNTTGKNVEVNAVKLYLISVIKAEFVASLLQSSVDSCSPVTCRHSRSAHITMNRERESLIHNTVNILQLFSSHWISSSCSSLFLPLALRDPHYSYITTYRHSDVWIVLSAIENIVFSLHN